MRNLLTIGGLTAAILLAVIPSSHAAIKLWDGGGADNNWTTGGNWDGTPPSAGDTLRFGFVGISALPNPNNDLPVGTSFSSITFVSLANPYTLSGNAVQLSGGITNSHTVLQTINMDLELTAGITISAANANVAANIVIGGVISAGAGSFGITKTGARTLILNAANTYEGGTILQGGTIQLGADDALGSGGLAFAGGVLAANNRSDTLGALTLTANSTLNFVADSTAGTLIFSSASSALGTEMLTIAGWSGAGASGGTDDRIFSTADPGSAFLSQIQFVGYDPGAIWLGTGEIVPVPEPTEWALVIFATLAVLYKFVLPRFRQTVAA